MLITSPVTDWKLIIPTAVEPVAQDHPVGTTAVQVPLETVCPSAQRALVGNAVGPSVDDTVEEGLAVTDDGALAADAELRVLADVLALAVQAAGTTARGAGSAYDSATRMIVNSATALTPAATQGVFAFDRGASATSACTPPAVSSAGAPSGTASSGDGSTAGVWSLSSATRHPLTSRPSRPTRCPSQGSGRP
jgi:hypothetical protein